MTDKVVRLGAGMAFWGDRVQPAADMVERADIDYLCCDHLAELTMSILAKQRSENPDLGYTRDLIDLLRGALPGGRAQGREGHQQRRRGQPARGGGAGRSSWPRSSGCPACGSPWSPATTSRPTSTA